MRMHCPTVFVYSDLLPVLDTTGTVFFFAENPVEEVYYLPDKAHEAGLVTAV